MLNLWFITEALQNLLSYFFIDYRYKTQSYWFKTALYTFLIVKCIYWLLYFRLFFGTNSIVFIRPASTGPVNNLAYLLLNAQSAPLNLSCIVLVLLLTLYALFFKKRLFVSDLLIWLITLNLHNRVYSTLSGGDFLLNQFLLFNCFLSYRQNPVVTKPGQLNVFLHNLSSIAIIVQLSLAYLLSGLAKLTDASWLGGQAIAITSQIKHVALYSFPGNLSPTNWVFTFTAYLVLFYQLSFPVFVFISPVKKTFLILGIAMHVYIALVMGLPWFSATMVMGYIYFWPLNKSKS